MCGIFGILSTNSNQVLSKTLYETILDALKELQNRGYDSSGIGLQPLSGEWLLQKHSSSQTVTSLEELENRSNLIPNHRSIHVGFGHNRWATHGAKTALNAHPHISSNGMVGVVHNGIIENYQELKRFLVENGFQFISETDTEVIPNLIAYYYKIDKDPIIAIRHSIERLQGTYGLVIIFNGASIYGVSSGSPLLFGHNSGYGMFSSEPAGFCNLVDTYVTLDKNDICEMVLERDGVCVRTQNIYTEKKIPDIFETLSTPNEYKHWTLKEIYDQPTAFMNTLNNGGRIYDDLHVKLGGLDTCKKELLECQHMVFIGCGSSFFSACIGEKYCKKWCNFQSVVAIDGCEFEECDIPLHGKVCFVFISQSGETKELHKCLQLIQDNTKGTTDYVTLGVVNVVDSLISREVTCGVYCNSGRERGVASTKSFTCQTICLSLISLWFSQNHYSDTHRNTICGNVIQDLQEVSALCSNLFKQEIQFQLQKLLSKFNNVTKVFLLGKGIDYFIAKEASLKLKEIAYIHAEAYSSSSLKHGPFALLDEDFPVILIDTQPEYYIKNDIAIQEISCRGAPIFIFTNRSMGIKENPNIIKVPCSNYSFLFVLIYLQLFAYNLSIQRNINPDIPRNLAKVVTVE
jgi:glucosamine--fructose-6-phosphate aminotransferase (isomerizing)